MKISFRGITLDKRGISIAPDKAFLQLNSTSIFLKSQQKYICCGYSLEAPDLAKAVFTSTHIIHFCGELRTRVARRQRSSPERADQRRKQSLNIKDKMQNSNTTVK